MEMLDFNTKQKNRRSMPQNGDSNELHEEEIGSRIWIMRLAPGGASGASHAPDHLLWHRFGHHGAVGYHQHPNDEHAQARVGRSFHHRSHARVHHCSDQKHENAINHHESAEISHPPLAIGGGTQKRSY